MRKYRIVIVENDEDEQYFMREAFSEEISFDIISIAKNGDALFDWMERNENALPHLILSDLNMPGKNGYDIINGIRTNAAYQHIPVIITSTSSTQSIINKCLDLGAADYIVKPDTFIDYKPYVKRLYKLIEEKELVK
jgi:CheY-like chemotaxis protein